MHPSQTYSSDLTDRDWQLLEPLLPKPNPTGRTIEHPRRTILNAIFYLNRTGSQWSMLRKDFSPRSTVFDHFSAARQSGLWEKLNEALRVKVRVAEGRKPAPTSARASNVPSRVAQRWVTMRARRSAGASALCSWIPWV